MLCALMLTGGVGAAAEKEQQAESLLVLTGIDSLADSIPAQFAGQIAAYRKTMPPEAFAVFEKVLKGTFDPKRFKRIIKTAVVEGYDAERMTGALKWFGSPLARRLSELEKKGGSPEGRRGMQAFVQGFKAKPPAQDRVQLMVRMVRVEEAADLAIKLVLQISKTMMNGVSALKPESQRMKPADIEKTLATIRKQITAPLANQIVVQYLYNYRDVSAENIGKSIAYFESKDGKWVKVVIFKGLFGAFSRMGEEMGSKLVTEFQKMKKTQ